jgi:hypothetical protein
MPTIIERNKETGAGLAFDFPADWQVVKYDQDENPATAETAGFYRRVVLGEGEEGSEDAQGIRAMDIVCRLPGLPAHLQLIEIKDDRKRTKEKGERETELYTTVLLKTAGTLTGLLLAERLGDASLQPMACLSRQPVVEVILFLIEPVAEQVADIGSKRKLRRLAKLQIKTTLDQRLSSTLRRWGLPFALYNLTNRLPSDWRVREVAPATF